MKFGHRLHGEITDYDEKGRGLFILTDTEKQHGYRLGAGTVAVPFSAQGDQVVATFVKRDKGVKIARLEEIVEPGPDRVPAPCPHAGICGGCLWQHLRYEAQLDLKQRLINASLAHAGHEERIDKVISSPDQFYYRNRMDYAIGWLGSVGLKEYGSWNRYLDLETCLLLDRETPLILQTVRDILKEGDLEPWDAREHTGLVRYVVIRLGKKTNQRMIMLVVSDLTQVNEKARSTLTERLSPLCTSLLLGEQPRITDLSLVDDVVTLHGNPWLEEKVNDIRYRIHPNSFFQTNTTMAATLQDTVLAQIPVSSRNLLDLYCGLGFFDIAAAKQHPHLSMAGFELDAHAIVLAKENARLNGVDQQTTFVSGPAEDLSWQELPADTVIVDPPRAGLHPRVLEALMKKKPATLIYVSCNYHRFAEELKTFKAAYDITAMQALDLFPHTPHVELVTTLVARA